MKKFSVQFAAAVFSILLIFGATQGMAQEKILKVGVMAPFTGPSAQTGDEFKSVSTWPSTTSTTDRGLQDRADLDRLPVRSRQGRQRVRRGGRTQGHGGRHAELAQLRGDIGHGRGAQYKVPHLFAFGAAPIINEKYKSDPEKYKYWCGKGWPVPAKLTLGYTECLQDAIAKGLWKPAKKLVAIYGEDTDWGRSQGEALTQEFKKIGWEVLSQDYFPPTRPTSIPC